MQKWALRGGLVVSGVLLGLALTEAAFWLRDDGAFPHVNLYVADAELGARLMPDASQRIAFAGNPTTSLRTNRQGYRAGAPATASCDEFNIRDHYPGGVPVRAVSDYVPTSADDSSQSSSGDPEYTGSAFSRLAV